MTIHAPYIPEREATDRNRFLIILAFFLGSCIVGGLWGTSGSGSIVIGETLLPGARFILIYACIWAMSLLLFLSFPLKNNDPRSIMLIAIAVMTSRAFLFLQSPSDDAFRYLWEGSLLAEGFNPYLLSPDSPVLSHLAADYPFHSQINHPGVPAAYPPFVLFFFSVVSQFSISLPFLKLVLLLFDIGSLFFLRTILQKRHLPERWLLFYAINPLILYSFAGEGHFDSMQIFFLLGALWCHDRQKHGWLWVFAGLAVQVKYVALVAVPFLLNRENIKYLPLFFITVILPYLPFAGKDFLSVFNGIRQFEGDFAFNGSVNGLIRLITRNRELASYLCRIGFLAVWMIGFLRLNSLRKKNTDPIKGITFAFSALLLLSPTIHLWYLTWILPFAIIRQTGSWLILTLFAGFYYTAKSVAWHGGDWGMPIWAQIIEWFPFYLFFIFEFFFGLRRPATPVNNSALTLSVVIPVLNEERQIVSSIQSLREDPAVSEIIVVDGNSSDNTRTAAEKSGATVLVNKSAYDQGGGRGGQILQGIQHATGDIIAIVHSDIRIHSPLFSEICRVLDQNPDIVGGAAGSRFETTDLKMILIEILNTLRALFFGISFGDQIQFFRRKPVIDKNLFPDIPLMEDVEFSLRLPIAGRRIFLFNDATVSARHWKKGWGNNFFIVIRLFSSWLIQRPFRMPDAVRMYEIYYRKPR